MTKILIVEDEPIVRGVVATYLHREGYETVEAADGIEAQELITREAPALAVIDIMLPRLDGLELCRWVRSHHTMPVILLSARGDETDRIVGLEIGADDYVTKPFSPRELACRVRAVLRRGRDAPPAERIVVAGLEIDAGSRRVLRDGVALTLTPLEFDLLRFLATHPGRVFSRAQLMTRVWGYSSAVDTGTVTVHVRRLREKIEVDPGHPRTLETVWGVGYRFTA